MGRQPSCGLGWVLEYSSFSSSFTIPVLRNFSEIAMEKSGTPTSAKCYLCSVTFIERWYTTVTSQVWQRPQQASVVMRSPLQPGFWATKENSRTAQPRKPWSVLVMATHTTAVPATRRMIKERCMLGMIGRGKRVLFHYLYPFFSFPIDLLYLGGIQVTLKLRCHILSCLHYKWRNKHLIEVLKKKRKKSDSCPPVFPVTCHESWALK